MARMVHVGHRIRKSDEFIEQAQTVDTDLTDHNTFSKAGTCEIDNVDATFTNVHEAESHADATDDHTILIVSALLVGVVSRDSKLYYFDRIRGEVGTIWDDSPNGLSVVMWMRRPMVHKFMVWCVNLQVVCTVTSVPAPHWLPAWTVTIGSITNLVTIAVIWIYMLLRLRYTWPTRARWTASGAREPWWQMWIILMLIWETVAYVLYYFNIGVETVQTWHDEMHFSRQLSIASGFLRASLIVYFYDSVHTPRHLYPCTCTHRHVCPTYISATAFSHHLTILVTLQSAHALACPGIRTSLRPCLPHPRHPAAFGFYPSSHPSPGCSQVRKLLPILVAIVCKLRYMAAFIVCSFVAHFMIMEASAAGVTEESKASSLGNEDGIWDGMWQMYIGMTTANNPG